MFRMHSLSEAPAMMGKGLNRGVLPGLEHLAIDAALVGIGLWIAYKIGKNLLNSAK